MKPIDTHVHVWPAGTRPPAVGQPYQGAADPEYLIQEMDRCGVEAAVLITPKVLGIDNSYALTAMQTFPDRFLAVIGVVDYRNPVAEAERLVREAAAGQLHGIRLHPCFDPDLDLSAPALEPIWQACSTAGLPILIHLDPAQYPQLEALLGRRPDLTVLIDHLGRYPVGSGRESADWRRLVGMARFPRVQMKISSVPWLLRGGLSPDLLLPLVEDVVAAFGDDRIQWGADWPVLLGVGGEYKATVAHGLSLPLSGGARTKFLRENARKLFARPRS